jgi:hypothetical protein
LRDLRGHEERTTRVWLESRTADASVILGARRRMIWLLSKGEGIVPIPGTKRTARVEENCAADGIELRLLELSGGVESQRGHDALGRSSRLRVELASGVRQTRPC